MFPTIARAAILPIKLLFGFDVFISYSRHDGAEYAENLERELAKILSPRMDIQETKPGITIPFSLRMGITMSKVLVLVTTRAAAESTHIESEVLTFLEWSNGPIILVELSYPVDRARYRRHVPGLPVLVENEEAGRSPTHPSTRVIQRVVNNVGYWRRSRRQLLVSAALAVILIVLVSLNYRASLSLSVATKEVDRQRGLAIEQQKAAETARAQEKVATQEAARQSGLAAAAAKATEEVEQQRARQQTIAAWEAAARQATRDLEGHIDDDRSALLAVQAMLLHHRTPEQPRYAVEEALQKAVHSAGFAHVLRGHLGLVRRVAFSRDGAWVVSGSDDKTIRVWNLRRPTLKPVVLAASGIVFSISVDSHGRFAAATGDNAIKIWDLRDAGRPPRVLRTPCRVLSVAFSSDGRRIASSCPESTDLWDLTGPVEVSRKLTDVGAFCTAISNDGHLAAAGSVDNVVRVFDLDKPAAPPRMLKGHQDSIWSVDFTREGDRIASASSDRTIRIWDVKLFGMPMQVLSGSPGAVSAVAFGPDNQHLASASEERSVRLWDLAYPEAPPKVLSADGGTLASVAFAPDGSQVAAAGDDGAIRLWQLHSTNPVTEFRMPHVPDAVPKGQQLPDEVAFAPDGNWVASGSTTVYLWKLGHPTQAVSLPGVDSPRELVFSWDSTLLASPNLNHDARIWDVRRPTKPPIILSSGSRAFYSAALSTSRSNRIVTGDVTSVRVWDVRKGVAIGAKLDGQQGQAWSVALSPDGNQAASASQDGIVRVWNLRQSQPRPTLFSGHSDLVSFLRFAPDGVHLASTSNDGTIRVWDATRPKASPQILRGIVHGVRSLAFAPTSDRIAFSQDETVRIWDQRRPYALPHVLAGHQSPVRTVAFSPDGNQVYSSSGDGVVRIWPLWSAAATYLCSRVWRNLSLEEWRTYIGPNIPYERTCPNLPPG
jgi:WD40 repeat protein